jgi:hypothetical protein
MNEQSSVKEVELSSDSEPTNVTEPADSIEGTADTLVIKEKKKKKKDDNLSQRG